MTTKLTPGFPCWTDLCTSDVEGAHKFYGDLFGWTFGPAQNEFADYSRVYKDGKTVAGLMPLMPGMTTSVWTLYFGTDDISKNEQTIKEQGGNVMSPPMAVGALGSMMVAADPTGAVFGLWQPDTFGGAELMNEPGSMVWEDLRSHDPAKSRAFYTGLFGYRHDELPMVMPMDYKTFAFADSDRPLGGMGDMAGNDSAQVPSHWVVYFKVEDTPAAMNTVKAGGGTVLGDMMPTPFGRQATVVDPFGGAFCIIDGHTA